MRHARNTKILDKLSKMWFNFYRWRGKASPPNERGHTMMMEFYTPNGYQTVESPEYKPFTFVYIVNNNGQWTPKSFTATAEYSDGYNAWYRRNFKKIDDDQEWAIYSVFRYETVDTVFAQLTAAVARLADLDEDEARYQTARIRTLASKYDRALDKAEFNRKAEAENAVNA